VGDYQRLEFLGDSLLDDVIVVAGYFTQQVHGR
jgi:dsRNA-specific ribonuclease